MSEDAVDIAVEHISSHGSAVQAVVEAVQGATGADQPPDEPLFDSIDPDILDWIVEDSNDASVRVGFVFGNCEITVRGDGTVTAIPNDSNGAHAQYLDGFDVPERQGETNEG